MDTADRITILRRHLPRDAIAAVLGVEPGEVADFSADPSEVPVLSAPVPVRVETVTGPAASFTSVNPEQKYPELMAGDSEDYPGWGTVFTMGDPEEFDFSVHLHRDGVYQLAAMLEADPNDADSFSGSAWFNIDTDEDTIMGQARTSWTAITEPQGVALVDIGRLVAGDKIRLSVAASIVGAGTATVGGFIFLTWLGPDI